MNRFPVIIPWMIPLLVLGCSSKQTDSTPTAEKPDSLCDSACDSSPLSYPVVSAQGGYGAVTTYGNASNPEFSSGGACNYGAGQILNYAAVHVDKEPGDHDGLWDGGRHCGDCLRVRVGSDTGWRSIIVRVVDKCPDAYCGIDLGGNPAKELMGTQPGRYHGEWEWVDCADAPGIQDGEPTLVTKDGSNPWWSLVQVRNGPAAVVSISYDGGTFAWAKEAENFYKVPEDVLQSQDSLLLRIEYRNGHIDSINVIGTALGFETFSHVLP